MEGANGYAGNMEQTGNMEQAGNRHRLALNGFWHESWHQTRLRMKYAIKKRFFALGNDYDILDEDGQKVFFVNGKVFSIGNKLQFEDMNGEVLFRIRQKVLSWGATYLIEQNEQVVATLHKKMFTFFSCQYHLQDTDEATLEIRGDFFEHEYLFLLDGHEVASVSKKWFSFKNTYGVDIDAQMNPLLVLATVIVVDLVCHNEKQQSS